MQNNSINGNSRKDIKIDSEVEIIQKHHQRTGELTSGRVFRILTKSSNHPHGIKVELDSGEIGRVKNILS
jgi:uncharacterized repeat protein (TIGR03833 family)